MTNNGTPWQSPRIRAAFAGEGDGPKASNASAESTELPDVLSDALQGASAAPENPAIKAAFRIAVNFWRARIQE